MIKKVVRIIFQLGPDIDLTTTKTTSQKYMTDFQLYTQTPDTSSVENNDVRNDTMINSE